MKESKRKGGIPGFDAQAFLRGYYISLVTVTMAALASWDS